MDIVEAFEVSRETWQRLRDLRLRALQESPESFASTFEKESAYSEADWIDLLSHESWLMLSINGRDVGIFAAKECDRSADWNKEVDCFIHSCWLDPLLRGKEVLPKMIKQLDSYCRSYGYHKLGLGVWPENTRAIRAYEKLGWEQRGGLIPSKKVPGRLFVAMFKDI
ncbi:GNAT family N-acetyltransferase [archaeon]|nr:MAG: GNAT family N-acetyltransferase [archaeon]